MIQSVRNVHERQVYQVQSRLVLPFASGRWGGGETSHEEWLLMSMKFSSGSWHLSKILNTQTVF